MFMDRDQRIRTVLERIAQKPLGIDREASLFDSGLLDSFLLVDLVGGLEQEFQIKIPDSDLIPQRFDSISRIDQYLTARSTE
jgi:acyl carrier protein